LPGRLIKRKTMEKTKVIFTRKFQEHGPGDVVELPSIVAANYIYRNFCQLADDGSIESGGESKEQAPLYTDKELSPMKKTKKK